jgi:hypothetical protein
MRPRRAKGPVMRRSKISHREMVHPRLSRVTEQEAISGRPAVAASLIAASTVPFDRGHGKTGFDGETRCW